VGRGRRPVGERRAAAEVDAEGGRVQQADGRAQHLVQRVAGVLQVDQVRHGRQQVAQQFAVALLGGDGDGDLVRLDLQAEQLRVGGGQTRGGGGGGLRGGGGRGGRGGGGRLRNRRRRRHGRRRRELAGERDCPDAAVAEDARVGRAGGGAQVQVP